MSALRKVIRKKVATVLNAAASVTSLATVIESRYSPLWESELPLVLVYVDGENSEKINESPREYQRDIRLGFEIVAEALDGVEDTLDDIAEAVEQVIFADETLGGTASDSMLKSVDIEFRTQAQKTVGALLIGFAVPYRQVVPDYSALVLDDLETIDADWNLAPVDVDVDATDTIVLPIV